MGDWWIRLGVGVLALWRIAVWLWYEHAAECPRAFICRWPWAARQLACFWCVSFWLAWPIALVAWLWWWALIPVALSGAVILLSGGGRIIWKETVDV